jgi:uncharacterized protein YyaL (SSP411 family)
MEDLQMINAAQDANRLIHEKSPYLLQHAHNPVHWYPWGEEAFAKAKAEDKPVFLSIGYSTCHWCHVMERESFADLEVAEFLNKYYIAIKVDREERPDIDHIYMLVCQAIAGQGGWPLTIIMTPDKKPFFAGTYFPKHSKFGRPGLLELLPEIAAQWGTNREKIAQISDKITAAIQPKNHQTADSKLDATTLREAYNFLRNTFDPQYGGFGSAPKFPIPHNLTFLLRYWQAKGEEQALAMVEKTLQAMYAGGIYDHLGYGFARYSVDRKWLVPHFEKMLYDNSLLVMAYLETYQATGKKVYAQAAKEIITYILRDLTSPEGGFYAAEDADSEGVEGKFYVWTPAEIKAVLGEELGSLFCQWYDVTEQGNFAGKNILNLIDKVAAHQDKGLQDKLEQAKQQLYIAREQRVHPHKDDKVLTAWNGLTIAALAMGARILKDNAYLDAATKAANFLWTTLRNKQGRLLARYREGEAAYLAYLDDYAFFTWGLIELYQADMHTLWLERALQLQSEQNKLFWDQEQGGYFFTGDDGEKLLARSKEIYDGALPSGNSVSVLNLLRLSRLTDNENFSTMAEIILTYFAGDVSNYPAGYTQLLTALHFALTPGRQVVIAGKKKLADLRQEIAPLSQVFAPNTLFIYHLEEDKKIEAINPFVRDMKPQAEHTTYYICQNFSCLQPTTDLAKVMQLLRN